MKDAKRLCLSLMHCIFVCYTSKNLYIAHKLAPHILNVDPSFTCLPGSPNG